MPIGTILWFGGQSSAVVGAAVEQLSAWLLVSITVTVNEPLAVRPFLSVTVQFTGVVPIAKVDPDTGVQTAVIAPSSTSLPVAVKLTAAPAALVAGVVMLAGGVNVGALLVTVTVNAPVAVAPFESVTVQREGRKHSREDQGRDGRRPESVTSRRCLNRSWLPLFQCVSVPCQPRRAVERRRGHCGLMT